MERQGKAVEITDAAINKLTEDGYNTAYGARFLKRHIDEKVKLPITGMWKTSARFSVDLEDGEVVVKPEGGTNPGLN
jgi:ATP-dependent Clp protease ATP-binding subunit ClpA